LEWLHRVEALAVELELSLDHRLKDRVKVGDSEVDDFGDFRLELRVEGLKVVFVLDELLLLERQLGGVVRGLLHELSLVFS